MSKFKQQEENIKICERALKKARTDSERSAAEYNLKSAREHLENLKKDDAIAEANAKKYKKKNKKDKKSKKRKKLGCLWSILKICTLGLLASGARR